MREIGLKEQTIGALEREVKIMGAKVAAQEARGQQAGVAAEEAAQKANKHIELLTKQLLEHQNTISQLQSTNLETRHAKQ